MTKPTTQWSANTAKATPVVAYSSASVTYNSATTKYSAVNVALADDGKQTTEWDGSDKNRTAWAVNPASVSTSTYEPAGVTYDTIFGVYDGVSGESPVQTKEPTEWS